MTPTGLITYCNDSLNSRKPYTYSFIIKDTNQDEPNEETHQARSVKVPNRELQCPLGGPPQPCVHQPRSAKVQCPQLLLGFHLIRTTDGLICCVTELNLQPHPTIPPQSPTL